MKLGTFASLLMIFAAATWHTASAMASVRPLSQYGQIQNVQNYSSNPFWSPNAPYNQKMPTAVYVTGPDVGSSDCARTVASIIASQCARMNNCYGKTLSDIRPNVIVELSRMPGHNFATACAGYIDSEFDNYMRGAANNVQPTAFPTATGASVNATGGAQNNQINIPALNQKQPPKWATDAAGRTAELAALQAQTADPLDNTITPTGFVKTINDVSFVDRMQNAATGYAPYKDAKAYTGIKLETEEAALERRLRRQDMMRQYCEKGLEPQLAVYNADLAKIKQCQANKTPISKCKLTGTYYY